VKKADEQSYFLEKIQDEVLKSIRIRKPKFLEILVETLLIGNMNPKIKKIYYTIMRIVTKNSLYNCSCLMREEFLKILLFAIRVEKNEELKPMILEILQSILQLGYTIPVIKRIFKAMKYAMDLKEWFGRSIE